MAAARLAPPNIVRRQIAPERWETTRDCRTDAQGRQSCDTRNRFVPAQWTEDDLNADARFALNRRCMAGHGFVAAGLRPWRLFPPRPDQPPPAAVARGGAPGPAAPVPVPSPFAGQGGPGIVAARVGDPGAPEKPAPGMPGR